MRGNALSLLRPTICALPRFHSLAREPHPSGITRAMRFMPQRILRQIIASCRVADILGALTLHISFATVVPATSQRPGWE
jgi:hypothetical protein